MRRCSLPFLWYLHPWRWTLDTFWLQPELWRYLLREEVPWLAGCPPVEEILSGSVWLCVGVLDCLVPDLQSAQLWEKQEISSLLFKLATFTFTFWTMGFFQPLTYILVQFALRKLNSHKSYIACVEEQQVFFSWFLLFWTLPWQVKKKKKKKKLFL